MLSRSDLEEQVIAQARLLADALVEAAGRELYRLCPGPDDGEIPWESCHPATATVYRTIAHRIVTAHLSHASSA